MGIGDGEHCVECIEADLWLMTAWEGVTWIGKWCYKDTTRRCGPRTCNTHTPKGSGPLYPVASDKLCKLAAFDLFLFRYYSGKSHEPTIQTSTVKSFAAFLYRAPIPPNSGLAPVSSVVLF